MSDALPSQFAGARGVVLYDGSCGFCTLWVPYWEKTLKRRRFRIDQLQSAWVSEQLQLSGDEMIEDLLLLLSDNRIIRGADVYLYIMKRIWWALPFGLLFSVPGLRWIFWRFYRLFKRNRFRVSKACGLKGKSSKE